MTPFKSVSDEKRVVRQQLKFAEELRDRMILSIWEQRDLIDDLKEKLESLEKVNDLV
jgi:hypothetical protein